MIRAFRARQQCRYRHLLAIVLALFLCLNVCFLAVDIRSLHHSGEDVAMDAGSLSRRQPKSICDRMKNPLAICSWTGYCCGPTAQTQGLAENSIEVTEHAPVIATPENIPRYLFIQKNKF